MFSRAVTRRAEEARPSRRVERSELDQIVDAERRRRGTAGCEQRPVERQRRDDRVHTAPSGRRTSTIGLASSTRRPPAPTTRSMTWRRCSVVPERDGLAGKPPAPLDVHRARAR